MSKQSADDEARLLFYFENEIEGKIYDPKVVHEMYMSDTVNDRMDHELLKPLPSGNYRIVGLVIAAFVAGVVIMAVIMIAFAKTQVQ